MNPFGAEPVPSKKQTLLRWLRYARQRDVEIRSFPLFWRVRERKNNLVFSVRRFLFTLKTSLEEGKQWNSSRLLLFRTFLLPFLGAAAFVVAIEILSHYAARILAWTAQDVPAWATAPFFFYQSLFTIEPAGYVSTYRTLLGPITTVSGAFLGLYFTAFNSLIGSTYRQLPRDVRTLLIRDKVGSGYTRVVAFTGSYALLLFGLVTIGYVPSLTSLILLVCLGIAEIYCFLFQWIRLFQLFDPSNLVHFLRRDLSLLVEEAAIPGRWALDPSFQSTFQKRAEKLLSTYRNLIFFVGGEEHLRGQSLMKLATEIIQLVFFYEHRKYQIPTESFWFRRTFLHKDWITASSSETSMALETGTSLRPTEVPEHLWLEKEIGKVLDFALARFLQKRDLQNALSLSQYFQSVTRHLSRAYRIEESFALFRIIKKRVDEFVEEFEMPLLSDEESVDSVRFTIALVDFNALSFIDVALGFFESTEGLTIDELKKNLADINWKIERDLYKTRLPAEVIKQLEYFRKRILFELNVEGVVITPEWYLLQLLALSYFRFTHSALDRLLSEVEDLFVSGATKMMSKKQHVLAAELIGRGFEACNKLEHHLRSLEKRLNDLEQTQILSDIPRKKFEWEEVYKRIEKAQETLVVQFSGALTEIIKLPRTQQLPDYFGQAYVTLTNECYWALVNKNAELFKKLFGPVFIACFEAFERQQKLEIADPESKFVLIADPIIDLVEISGYARIYEDLDGQRYWATVKNAWDKYHEGVGDKTARGSFVVLLSGHRSIMMSPRSIDRTRWEMALGSTLRERGLTRDMFGGFYPEVEPPKHASSIINSMSHYALLHDKARDVFIATYFAEEIGSNTLTVPDGAARLYDELHRDEKGDE